MLANKIKFVLIACASLILLGQTACKWQPEECRSKEGCQCVVDCDPPSQPTPK